MKIFKKIVSILITINILTILCACNTDNEKNDISNDKQDCFIIIHSSESVDRQIANTVADMIRNDGKAVRIFDTVLPENENAEHTKAIITIGRSITANIAAKDKIPHIYCNTDGGGMIEGNELGIAPVVDSAALAECTMVLLPDAKSFSIISGGEGGKDVQGACEMFDRTEKDYTVESLDGRIYGEVLLCCLESDTDALLLPAGASGNKNASATALPYIPESNVPVIAVGMGEPLKGALATFCIDSEAVSIALYSLINSTVYGHTPDYTDNYYVLCINKERAADLDERAKKNATELFPVVWVE